MSTKKAIHDVVSYIEQHIAATYDLSNLPAVRDHLINSTELESSLGDQVPTDLTRAGLVVNEAGDEAFVGIFLDDGLLQKLAKTPPMRELNHDNLDAFSVLVEEISHFMMLATRLSTNRGVSRLEMELQGEMDKMLTAATLLQHQAGDPHVEHLTHIMFDRSAVVSPWHRETYTEANRVAGRFWHGIRRRMAGGGDREQIMSEVGQVLRQTYSATWDEKQRLMDLCARPSRRKVA